METTNNLRLILLEEDLRIFIFIYGLRKTFLGPRDCIGLQ